MAGYIGSKAVLLSTTAATVTGDMTVDTSTLKVDSTNNKVGIGTASPTSALHVSGGAGTNIAIQSSAGTHWRIGDGVGSTNGNLVIYDYTDSRKVFEIDTLGHVTMPSQPAFLVRLSTGQAFNATTVTTVSWNTEVFDNNADFGSSTFTAPVTGKYQFNVNIRFDSADAGANYYNVYLVTSNRTHYNIQSLIGLDQDVNHWQMNFSVLADMDASDTAYVRVYQDGGSTQADVDGQDVTSSFSGYLVC